MKIIPGNTCHRAGKAADAIYILVAVFFTILSWLLFKFFYPNPNIIFDSYLYTQAAIDNQGIGLYPIGYSVFIRLVGSISHSPFLLVTLQYFLLNFSLTIFFFTIHRLFKLHKILAGSLLALLLLNPIIIYISNLVLSDALFVTLSLLWLSNLLLMIFKPASWRLLLNMLLVGLCFTVRYNALYYPLVSAIAFLLTGMNWKFKTAGMISPLLITGCFILFTCARAQKLSGISQFSAFGSWKLASNALYVYENVSHKDLSAVPDKFKALHAVVKDHFNRPHYKVDMMTEDPTFGSYYMWMGDSPLIQFLFLSDSTIKNLFSYKAFAPVAPLYKDYGRWIISHHPVAFGRYFVLPNFFRYLNPQQEVLTDTIHPFVLRLDGLGLPTARWFGINDISTPKQSIQLRYQVFSLYPVINGVIHLVYWLSFIFFIVYFRQGRLPQRHFYRALIFVAFLCLTDLCFSLLSSAVVLRYQIFILTVETAFSVIQVDCLLSHTTTSEEQLDTIKK